jgi:peptide/nickel transport system substrate-binding protein
MMSTDRTIDMPAATTTTRQWSDWTLSRRKLFGLGAGAALAGAAVANGGHARVARAAQAEGTPIMGGTLTMSLADADVQSFDPIVPTDNMSIWTMLLIYDQLIRVAADGTSLEPGLAEKWERSQDNLTYTFHLRDAKFHDGTPVTAADVAYSLNRVVSDPTSTWAFLVGSIAKITPTDPKTVTITLKSTWAPFEADLALFACSIIPKAAHEQQKDQLFQKPIGSGPFTFVSWDKDQKIVLKKNPNYWEPGKPYLDQLEFSVLTDANARMLQFQGGELDIATTVPYSQIESLKANPDVVVLQESVARFDYIGMNTKRAPWDDKTLRQAINYAVDKQQIIDRVLFGSGELATSYLPKMAGRDDSLKGYPFDVNKAKELVAQSKGKGGFKAELVVTAGDPVSDQIGQLITAQMKAIGGEVKMVSLEAGAARQKVRKELDYDWQKGYYTTDIIDPDELTAFAVQSDGGSKAIYTQYQNPKVDELCKAAEVELDPAKRQEMYNQIQQMQLDDAPMIFLFYPTGGTATIKQVKNFHVLPTGNYRLWETWKEK